MVCGIIIFCTMVVIAVDWIRYEVMECDKRKI